MICCLFRLPLRVWLALVVHIAPSINAVGAAERTFDPCVGRDGDIIRAECSIFLGLLGGRFRSEAGEVSGLARLVV